MNPARPANPVRLHLTAVAALAAAGAAALVTSLSATLVSVLGPGRNGRAIVLVAACLLLAAGMSVPVQHVGNRLLRLWHRWTGRQVGPGAHRAWAARGRVRHMRPALTALGALWLAAAGLAVASLAAADALIGLDHWLSATFFWPGGAVWVLRLIVATLAASPLLAVGAAARVLDGVHAAAGGGRARLALAAAILGAVAAVLAAGGALEMAGIGIGVLALAAAVLWLGAAAWTLALSMRRGQSVEDAAPRPAVSRPRRWGRRATLFILALAFTGWAAGWQRASQVLGTRWPQADGVLWLVCVLSVLAGALVARRWIAPGPSWRRGVLLAGTAVLGTVSLLHTAWMAAAADWPAGLAAVLTAAALAGPASFGVGICASLIVRGVRPGVSGVWVQLLRPLLLGAAAGCILWVQWLVPALGTAAASVTGGLLLLAAGGCWILYDRGLPAARRTVAGAGIALAAVCIAAVVPLRSLPRWLATAGASQRSDASHHSPDGQRLRPEFVREGHSEVYSVCIDAAGVGHLQVDGAYDLSPPLLAQAAAALPFRLHARVRAMLLIDAAWPALLAQAESRNVIQADLAGQEAASVEAQLFRLGEPAGLRLRLQPLATDLQDVLSQPRRYDLIAVGLFPPAHRHAGHRWSLQRLDQVLGLLADGGLAVLYLPLADISAAALQIIVDTAALAGQQRGLVVQVWGIAAQQDGTPPAVAAVTFAPTLRLLADNPAGGVQHWGLLPPPDEPSHVERDDRPLLAAAAWANRRQPVSDAANAAWVRRRAKSLSGGGD